MDGGTFGGTTTIPPVAIPPDTPNSPELGAQLMVLTDTAIKRLRPADKPNNLADGKGLYLMVNPSGGKLWRWKYRFDGKEKLMPLGA